VAWTVEVTEEFESWWNQLGDDERVSIDGMVRVLETHGPALGDPYSMEVSDSRDRQVLQLLVPHQDRKICVLYISDEVRCALVLLTGTALTRDEECPPEQVVVAEVIYGKYLERRGQPPC
jgi:hypothetical protein